MEDDLRTALAIETVPPRRSTRMTCVPHHPQNGDPGHAGNRSIDILTDEEKPGHVRFSRVWDSRDHWEKFRAWRTEQGTFAQLGEYFIAPPATSYFKMTDV